MEKKIRDFKGVRSKRWTFWCPAPPQEILATGLQWYNLNYIFYWCSAWILVYFVHIYVYTTIFHQLIAATYRSHVKQYPCGYCKLEYLWG